MFRDRGRTGAAFSGVQMVRGNALPCVQVVSGRAAEFCGKRAAAAFVFSREEKGEKAVWH